MCPHPFSAYDDLGRRTSLTRANGTVTSYAYDPVSRLAELEDDFAGTGDDHDIDFAYNPASQIVNRTGSNDQFAWTDHVNQTIADTHNGLNQIVTTGSTSVGHDGRGNASASARRACPYDENRLRTADRSTGSGQANLVYDPLGQLRTGRGSGRRFHLIDFPIATDKVNRLHIPGTQYRLGGLSVLFSYHDAGR